MKKCLACKDGRLGGARCLAPAVYLTKTGIPNCHKHAEEFIDAILSPYTIVGVLAREKHKKGLPSRDRLRQLYLKPIN